MLFVIQLIIGKLKNIMNKMCLVSLFMLMFSGCGEPPKPAKPIKLTSISQCDQHYDETTRMSQSTSSSSTYLKYDNVSGKVSIEAGDFKTHNHQVTFSMDKERFFEMCSPGKFGVGGTACPYYIECVSKVFHNQSIEKSELELLTFEGAAKIIREESIKLGQLKPSKLSLHPRAKEGSKPDYVANFIKACNAVSGTYSGSVVGATIFENVPEVPDFSTAMVLGDKAVKGYGECLCVLANYTGLNNVMSIGRCEGDRFISY